MSRRRKATKREFEPDYKYNSILVTQFINAIMRCGKKSTAQRVVYDAIDLIGKKTSQDGLAGFKKAVNNVKPSVEVKSKRIGGANYQIPVEVSSNRKTTLGIRWLIESARERSGRDMVERLGNELLAANNFEGNSIKKKEDTHRMAEANKAFAHFRWK